LPGLLHETGYRYLVEMSSVHDLARRYRIATPWLGYMGMGRLREALVQLGAGLLSPWRRHSPVVSVFLHPQAASSSPTCTHVLRALTWLLSDRRPVTYGGLLD
jgi:hypothetical protein